MKPKKFEISVEIIFQALSCQTRIQIIKLLGKNRNCVNAIAEKLGIPQTAVSQHLRVLRLAGIIESVKCGKESHYSIRRDVLSAVSDFLKKICESEKSCSCKEEETECDYHS